MCPCDSWRVSEKHTGNSYCHHSIYDIVLLRNHHRAFQWIDDLANMPKDPNGEINKGRPSTTVRPTVRGTRISGLGRRFRSSGRIDMDTILTDGRNAVKNETQGEPAVGSGCRKRRIVSVLLRGSRKGRRKTDGVNSKTAPTISTSDIRSGDRQPSKCELKVSCRTPERDEHKEEHIGEIINSNDALTQTLYIHVSDAVEADVDKDCADASDNEQPETAKRDSDLRSDAVKAYVTARKGRKRQDGFSGARVVPLFSTQIFVDKEKLLPLDGKLGQMQNWYVWMVM